MKMIVGLGNPGKEYEKTRHNVGFMALDKITKIYDFGDFKTEEKFEAEISQGEIAAEKIFLIKPQTFMNSSGRTVQKMMNFYKAGIDDLIVIHDDLDIALGEFRTGSGSRSAGHKGVQSIIDFLDSKDFKRIRVGIKIEDRKIPTEKFVLGTFTKKESEAITGALDGVIETVKKELT
ncbi:MAG: aminoacyl-tRNA hydrolase [Candidatus Pacebacteria bacterium]|nr:aminoacyl-tRNA hydrolase [Candidatus Paceibacterota bacterium]